MFDRDPFEELDKINAAGGAADGAGPSPTQAEIVRLAALSPTDYQTERPAAARRLGLGVVALDKAVAAERKRHAANAAASQRQLPPPASGEVRWPQGCAMKAHGLYGLASDHITPLWLSAPFEVLGHARDQAGEGWALWLRWHDLDGVPHNFALRNELTVADPGQMEAELVRRGLRVATDMEARRVLRRALGDVLSGDRVRIVYMTGWHGTDAAPGFLLPDGTALGCPAERVVLHALGADAHQRCAEVGTLDLWKTEVAALAKGNPLAMFCMSAAFAGPLLLPVIETGGGFHLFGPSKTGKTLALRMALSAWALPDKAGGALRDWRSTANALETAGEECTDSLLTLDEIHQANPADVASAAYMLADGAGKRRLTRDANSARRKVWRAMMLSTGEYDLATAVARAGHKLPAGADVRLPSVPVEGADTAWPDKHGRPDFAALAKDLHTAMQRQHGTAARAFVSHVANGQANEPGAILAFVDSYRERFATDLAAADPQVRDVARRFALVAAAGELATAWSILPWLPGDAERAVRIMFDAWLSRRSGGVGSAEAANQLERVRAVLIQHGQARFTALVQNLPNSAWVELDPGRQTPNRIGWRKSGGDRDEFLIPPETWRGEVCAPAGLDPSATARTLLAAKYLRCGPHDMTVKERLPGHGNPVRVYAISASLMEVENERQQKSTIPGGPTHGGK